MLRGPSAAASHSTLTADILGNVSPRRHTCPNHAIPVARQGLTSLSASTKQTEPVEVGRDIAQVIVCATTMAIRWHRKGFRNDDSRISGNLSPGNTGTIPGSGGTAQICDSPVARARFPACAPPCTGICHPSPVGSVVRKPPDPDIGDRPCPRSAGHGLLDVPATDPAALPTLVSWVRATLKPA